MNRFAFSLIVVLSLSCLSFAQTKIACVGNSITAGAYPGKLQALLGSGYQVSGEGVGGTTLLRQGDSPYWNTGAFQDVFRIKPNIITIKLGTNDSKSFNWGPYHSSFAADYNAMIDTFLTISPKPQIWLVLCTPSFTYGSGINGDTIDKDIVPIIRSVAAQQGLPIIDCHTPLFNHPECFGDGIHPTDAGADSIAHIFYRTLQGKPIIILSDSLLTVSYETGKPRQSKAVVLKALNSMLSVHLGGPVTVTNKRSWLTVAVNASNVDSQVITNTVAPASLPDVPAYYYDTVTVHATGAAVQDIVYRIEVWVREPAVLTSVVVAPHTVAISVAQSQQFSAAALDQFNVPLESQPVFSWSASGGGTITSTGMYTNDGCPGSFSITASISAITANAAITVTNQNALQAATASASSVAQGYTINAIKDGVVDGHEGHPGDASKEWSSSGEKANAWAQLAWANPTSIDSIALYDRPNLNDQVLSGTLAFSDGSSIPVGVLPNDASAPWGQKFAPRSVTWVKFTVNSVGSNTQNIGLAEFSVYNTQGCAPATPIKDAVPPDGMVPRLRIVGNKICISDPLKNGWNLEIFSFNGTLIRRIPGNGSAVVTLSGFNKGFAIARLRMSNAATYQILRTLEGQAAQKGIRRR
jgi:lysophospholipase L1-like esterase